LRPLSPQGNANISLSGGNPDGVSYFVSAGTMWEDGYFRNSAVGYNQYNFRSNIDAKITRISNSGLMSLVAWNKGNGHKNAVEEHSEFSME
jgi:hypothetical protein